MSNYFFLLKRTGKRSSTKKQLSPSFSPFFETNRGARLTRQTTERGKTWCTKKEAEQDGAGDERGQSERREHWKHFQGWIHWHWVRRPRCGLKNAFRWWTKLTEFQNQSRERWKKQLLDIIRVSHGCLHSREDETTTYSPTWLSCLSVQHCTPHRNAVVFAQLFMAVLSYSHGQIGGVGQHGEC